MIRQNVNIINFKSLYEILEEIKENLSFNIVEYDDEKNFLYQKENNSSDSLIIINSNTDLNKKNILIFNDLPITINKLIELINIKLIKLKFNLQSKITIKEYQLNLNSKIFSKGNTSLKLTEKEIEIISYLNEKKNKHNILDLQKNIWGYSTNIETHTVETHIYRLRKKISDKFNDKSFIMSHDEGYYIK